jgi:2-C-methyl-D-erythritol 2,4-cyclodiphosphate synthase
MQLQEQRQFFIVFRIVRVLNLFQQQLFHMSLNTLRRSILFRVGIGFDAHRLVKGRPLIIGGVRIPYDLGLSGHSDADVLIHAIIDGILGALAMGDIGIHFPDDDPAYKDIDSAILLRKVMELVKKEGYRINNLDNTIVAEKPKMTTHIPGMKERLSSILEILPGQINIKATTTEGMGFCGRGEGISAISIVSLEKKV